jgi:hypothetical protein
MSKVPFYCCHRNLCLFLFFMIWISLLDSHKILWHIGDLLVGWKVWVKSAEKNNTIKIIPPKLSEIILMSILIKYLIILPLAVINICPTVKFIADAKTLLLQCSISLPFSLSVSLLSCSLPTNFRCVFNPVVLMKSYHWINKFCQMLFSFIWVAYTKNLKRRNFWGCMLVKFCSLPMNPD